MSRRALTLTVGLVAILAVFAVYFGFYGKENKNITKQSEAASGSATLTSQAEWTAGTNTNTDLATVPGTVKINDKSSLTAIAMSGPITVSRNEADKSKVVDGNDATGWGWVTCDNNHDWWKIDLGSNYNLTKIRLKTTGDAPGIYTIYSSTDDIAYTQIYSRGGMFDLFENLDSGNTIGRYVKIDVYNAYVDACLGPYPTGVTVGVDEMSLYATASATHTSATTQLDAGAHTTMNWTTFVPSDTIPASTSINYRFRTSADAGTWGSYTASTASAGSIDIATLLGATDKLKRYLQVETTLANTDGASTPTLNAYTANYEYAVLDHLTVTPATASVVVSGTQSLTASAIDDYADPIVDATFTWSTTCGSVDAAGTTVTFTAPAAVPVGDICTVTASSTVDGVTKTADSVITVTASPPAETCSDGILNQNETGIDCGGVCSACPVVPPTPTCTDGIQNGTETGVDTGGSCGSTCPVGGENTCQQQSQDAESACFTNPPAGKTQQECVSEARCSQQACVVSCGGSGADTIVGTKVLVPNGGETYQLTRRMTVNWVYGNGNVDPNTPGAFPDPSKGEKTTFQNVPIGVVLSTDGGANYDKMLEMIYPAHLSSLTSNNIYSNWIAGSYGGYKPYTSYHAYNADSALNNGYYSYSFYIPNAVSLISDNARIKLVPVLFGCGGTINPDASDNNFRILAGPITPPPTPCIGPSCQPVTGISMTVSPDQAYLKPGQTQQYSAHVTDQSGADITSTCPVTWSMQTPTAGSIGGSGLMTATGNIGVWMDSVKATANCFGLSDFALVSFVTTNEARRLENAALNPGGVNVFDPVKVSAWFVTGYDQFGFSMGKLPSYSMTLLDDRIGTMPANVRGANITLSNNYGCYPNKIKGTATYNGVEKVAFGTINNYPADPTHIIIAPEDQVMTFASYSGPKYARPGQTIHYYTTITDQMHHALTVTSEKVYSTYILHNPAAGQLANNGTFIATTNVGSYPGAVESRQTYKGVVFSKTFDITVTTEQRKVAAWPASLGTIRMWPGSAYAYAKQAVDQFGDRVANIVGNFTPGYSFEDVSGKNLINVLGSRAISANNQTGIFKKAVKATFDVDEFNKIVSNDQDKILGPSAVSYLNLDINQGNDNPTTCLANPPQPVCDPSDPTCDTPQPPEPPIIGCIGFWCKLFPPGPIEPICIGSFCVATPIGWPVNPLVLIPLLLAGLLALLNPANLVLIGNILSKLYGLFTKGRDRKHAPGIVYESTSGIPVPNVLIYLFRFRDQKVIGVAKSDKSGKFALSIPVGEEYYLNIKKEGYDLLGANTFISKKLSLAYENNYFSNSKIVPGDQEKLFDLAVPLSPNADYNKIGTKISLFENVSKVLRIINLPIMLFGFSFAIFAATQSPSIINTVMLIIYLAAFMYQLVRYLTMARSFGIVTNSASQMPVPLATVRAISETNGKLVKTVVTDSKGHFLLAVPKDFYKIVTTKAGLLQNGNTPIRIRSALKPTKMRISMAESQRQQLEITNRKFVATATTSKRVFESSSEIIDRYNGEIKEIKHESVGQTPASATPESSNPNWKFS